MYSTHRSLRAARCTRLVGFYAHTQMASAALAQTQWASTAAAPRISSVEALPSGLAAQDAPSHPGTQGSQIR